MVVRATDGVPTVPTFQMFACNNTRIILTIRLLLQVNLVSYRCDHSCPHSHLYRGCSAVNLLGPSIHEWGSCRHGRHCHWSGLDTLTASRACVIRRMGPVLSLDPMTKQFESGMPSPVL